MVFNTSDFTIDGQECCAEELRAKQKRYVPLPKPKSQPDFTAPKPKFKTASPTINTRAAMNDVFDMFNAPLSCDVVEKQVAEDETISAKVFKPLATFGKLGVFQDEPGVLRDDAVAGQSRKLEVFRDEPAPRQKMEVFRDDPEKYDVEQPRRQKIEVFQDEPEKVNVKPAPRRKLEVFQDEPEKAHDDPAPRRKLEVFRDEPDKLNVFRDELAPKSKMQVFRDEPVEVDVREEPASAFEIFKYDVEESPGKVDASMQSPRGFIRAARNRKSNFRFDVNLDEEEDDSVENGSSAQIEEESQNADDVNLSLSETKGALQELLGLDPTIRRINPTNAQTPCKRAVGVVTEQTCHRDDVNSSFMSNDTDASLLDFKRALASQEPIYNPLATAKGERIFSGQVYSHSYNLSLIIC
jgi:hypothetical protein